MLGDMVAVKRSERHRLPAHAQNTFLFCIVEVPENVWVFFETEPPWSRIQACESTGIPKEDRSPFVFALSWLDPTLCVSTRRSTGERRNDLYEFMLTKFMDNRPSERVLVRAFCLCVQMHSGG